MKIFRHFVGVAAAVVLGASIAGAQSVQFKGTTTGCFLSSGLNFPDCNATSGIGFDRSLLFVGGAFNQTATGNPSTINIGDAAHASSNFGYFSLGSLPSNYTGDIFRLAISFDDPTNVSPSAVFQAVLYGSVNWFGDGTVTIDFGGPQQFAFNGPTYAGTFSLAINDIKIDPATLRDPYETITGSITTNVAGQVTSTPEPATIALMATGFVGLVPFARRRAKKAAQA